MQTIADKNEQHQVDKVKEHEYVINIEGVEHSWNKSTITTEQIAALGGWTTEGVIEIDKHNVERTLAPGEIIELKPGQGFAKKVRWQRGDNLFQDRLIQELGYLHGRFKNTVRQDMWFLVKDFHLPDGWSAPKTDIAFRIQPGYPVTPPYGFYVPTGIRFNGQIPTNYQDVMAEQPPFEGQWGMFSWAPEVWQASDNIGKGYNLLNWVLSFAVRLNQGA